MTEERIEPFFAHSEPGPRFKNKDLSHAIAASGVPYSAANARASSYAKHGQIHVREKGEATRPNLYAMSDMATAVILSALQEIGVADHDVLNAASLALYGWTLDGSDIPEKARFSHPVLHALKAVNDGGSATFTVDAWRDLQSGARNFTCRLTDGAGVTINANGVAPVTAFPAGTALVVLDQHFQPVLRALSDAAQGGRGH